MVHMIETGSLFLPLGARPCFKKPLNCVVHGPATELMHGTLAPPWTTINAIISSFQKQGLTMYQGLWNCSLNTAKSLS